MKALAVALLVVGAVIIAHAIGRYRAFFDFSPDANSETAGFITFRAMLGSLGYGLIAIILSGACFLIDHLTRRRSRKAIAVKNATIAA